MNKRQEDRRQKSFRCTGQYPNSSFSGRKPLPWPRALEEPPQLPRWALFPPRTKFMTCELCVLILLHTSLKPGFGALRWLLQCHTACEFMKSGSFLILPLVQPLLLWTTLMELGQNSAFPNQLATVFWFLPIILFYAIDFGGLGWSSSFASSYSSFSSFVVLGLCMSVCVHVDVCECSHTYDQRSS